MGGRSLNAVFWRDLRLALGEGGGFGQGIAFFVMVLFMFTLSLGADQEALSEIAPSIIMISILLSGLLNLERMFKNDDDDGTLSQLRLSPIPLSAIIITKIAVHYIVTGFAMTLFVPVYALMYNLSYEVSLNLILALLIGAPALSALGSIGAALTLSIKRSSLIQALVTMPLYIPTLIYGSMAAQQGEKQIAALSMLAGLTLFIIVFAPWVSAKIIERNHV